MRLNSRTCREGC